MFSNFKKTIHMKILRLFTFILILMNSTMLLADGFEMKLNVVEDKILAGEAFHVDIEITNPEEFYAFSLDIPLKPGTLEDPFVFEAFIPGDRFNGHTPSATVIDDGNTLRIFVFHQEETTAFDGNEGVVATIQLMAPEEPGNHLLDIENAILSDADGDALTPLIQVPATVTLVGNEMTILDAEVIIGQDVTIYVEIDNFQDFTAFQADIILPEEFEYVDGTAVLSDRAVENDHQLEVSEYIKDGNNILRLFATSPNNTLFEGKEGVVVQFDLSADINAPGIAYDLLYEVAIISDADGENIITGANKGVVTVFDNNTIIIHDAEGLTNETITMELEIDNSLPFVGFEVEVVFDDGFVFYPGTFELTERAHNSHIFEISELPGEDNGYKIFVFSPDNEVFSDFDGNVATFDVKLPNDPSVPGMPYQAQILKGILANQAGDEISSQTEDADIIVNAVIELALQDTDACSSAPVTIDLNLLNSQVLLAFETRVNVPEGFTYVPNSAVVNTDRVEEHIVDAQFNSDTQVLTVIVFSNNPAANEIHYVDESSWIVRFDLDAPNVMESTVFDIELFGSLAASENIDGIVPDEIDAEITLHPQPAIGFTFEDQGLADTGDTFYYCFNEPVSVTLSHIWYGTPPFDIEWTVTTDDGVFEGDPFAYGVELGGEVFGGIEAPGTYVIQVTSIIDAYGCSPVDYSPYTATVVIYEEITYTEPQDLTIDACDLLSQVDVDTEFNNWLDSALNDLTGGEAVTFTYTVDGEIPLLCEGGEVDVTWTITDEFCEYEEILSATFKLNAVPELVVVAPDSETHDACDFTDQGEVDAAFADWIGGFSVTGGCVAELPDLSVYEAPDLCEGGEVTITLHIEDIDDHICYAEMPPVSATFILNAVPELFVVVPDDEAHDACDFADQGEVDAAFADWIGGFSVAGGCDAELPDLSVYEAPDLCEGGEVTITLHIEDIDDHICYAEMPPVSATFMLNAVPELVVVAPDSETHDACDFADQGEVDAAFADWIGGFSVTGGCDAELPDLSGYEAPGLCSGGVVTITLHVEDIDDHICYAEMPPVSATFMLNAVPELVVVAPDSEAHDACDFADQGEVDAAFADWIAEFAVSGGCDAELPDLSEYEAPVLCEGGVVTVSFTVEDLCETIPVEATFMLTAPAPLVVVAPADATHDACDFADQAGVDAAFAAWIAEFEVSGGCDAELPDLSEYEAPVLCEGGIVEISYLIEDLCETMLLEATFTLNAPAPLVVVAPADAEHDACDVADQDAVDVAFAAWIAEFAVSGGCDAELPDLSDYTAPVLCEGGIVEISYLIEDLCETILLEATFTLNAPEAITYIHPVDASEDGNDFSSQQELEDAFEAWVTAQTDALNVEGGCDPVVTDDSDLAEIPELCDGGSVEVTWTITDLCEEITVSASFVFSQPEYTLTLIANPAEGGVVTGAGVYNCEEEVDVDAIPNEGWEFVNWTDVDGNEVSDQPANTITMPVSDLTLTANFEMIDYTLTLIANPAEGGVVTGAGVYNFGDEVDVDAIPNEGWAFVNWTDVDGNEVSDQPANTITMPAADLTLTANFELVEFEVTFYVVEDSADEDPIAGAMIHIDGVDETLITDASGMASIMLLIGEYTADITAENYEDVLGLEFSVVNEAIDVMVHMQDEIIEPFNLQIFTEGYDHGEALFVWNDGLHQFRYDDGVVAGQLGFQGTLNSVMGSAHHYAAELDEVIWWLTSEEGTHATVKVWVLGLDELGYPDKNNILYTNNAVPNVDNQWNKYTFSSPIDAPNGFFIGLSYEGYLSLAVDNGVGAPWDFQTGTQFTIFDISTDEAFTPLENDGFEVNFLLRAYGTKYGAVDKSDDVNNNVSSVPPVFIPVDVPFEAGDILINNYSKSFVGFDVFLDGTLVAEAIGATDFVFTELSTGTYTAGVRSVYTTGMSEIVTINFEIPDRTVRVQFTVVDNQGLPLENAVATLDGVQNAPGDYSFDGITAGTYDYTIEKDGYFTADGQVTVTDQSVFVNVVLQIDDTPVTDMDIQLMLYPNPVRSMLTIESNINITGVRMVDMLGQIVYDATMMTEHHEIDVYGFVRGIYFVQITTEKGVYTKRIQVTD